MNFRLLAAAANVAITRLIDLNLFTFKLWFVIPVGAIGMGDPPKSGFAGLTLR